ncbi:MAG: hypothetical protein M3Y64_05625 [Gemmatimonadota bacterium]|nr:hypothetical protein [Gemmatimonadota bacterium]
MPTLPAPNGDWFRDLVVSGGDQQNDIVEMALKAGANVDARDAYDKKAMIFSYDIPASRLAILVNHGANLQVFDEKRWTLLMNAVYFKRSGDGYDEFVAALNAKEAAVHHDRSK